MGKYHCTIDLLYGWFGIGCMTTDNFFFAKQTNPNQSNGRSTVQLYFPLQYSLLGEIQPEQKNGQKALVDVLGKLTFRKSTISFRIGKCFVDIGDDDSVNKNDVIGSVL
jgi:hypothetical protein